MSNVQTVETTADPLFLSCEGRRWPVSSLAEASEKFEAVRDRMMANGLGASDMPPVRLVSAEGDVRYYVSWNGRIWAGDLSDWKPDSVPVYEPRR